MKEDTKIPRNRPAEDGRKNDPDLRDRTDIEPGTSTISSSKTDEANQSLTKTAADNFREHDDDKNADPTFDDIHNE